MICAVYKSSRKADTYLFLPKRDDFSKVPAPLMEVFGTPIFVMLLPMTKVKQLGQSDLEKVKAELTEKGFYLQLPPPTEDLLKTHRRELGLDDES
ncbi:YcgL domain-containing protein [Ferrimonas balearica]|uniref:YcgL domain-containing protein n=1 Tax=Ferrimonas balearica TaxID=44012 RepID=UPI001C99ADAF|nr:YcgL domain-containing protein [Ferrimonas balearica]MBY5991421.1 YcgL domain-containing protein [Ferrimonas balearica]